MKLPRELHPLFKLQEELERAAAEGWVNPFGKIEVLEAAAECDASTCVRGGAPGSRIAR